MWKAFSQRMLKTLLRGRCNFDHMHNRVSNLFTHSFVRFFIVFLFLLLLLFCCCCFLLVFLLQGQSHHQRSTHGRYETRIRGQKIQKQFLIGLEQFISMFMRIYQPIEAKHEDRFQKIFEFHTMLS
mgnify:CR=1 FL=1